MKTATLPPLRVDGALRAAAESLLREGETLSGFVLEAVQLNIASSLRAACRRERKRARRAST